MRSDAFVKRYKVALHETLEDIADRWTFETLSANVTEMLNTEVYAQFERMIVTEGLLDWPITQRMFPGWWRLVSRKLAPIGWVKVRERSGELSRKDNRVWRFFATPSLLDRFAALKLQENSHVG